MAKRRTAADACGAYVHSSHDERPVLKAAVEAEFRREDLDSGRSCRGLAGGNWALRYLSAGAQYGRLDVENSFMCRVSLRPTTTSNSTALGPRPVSAARRPVGQRRFGSAAGGAPHRAGIRSSVQARKSSLWPGEMMSVDSDWWVRRSADLIAWPG